MNKPLITWDPAYEIGIAEVDSEHRHLIDMLNSIHAAVIANAGTDAASYQLGELHARIAGHFALEEKMMRERGYPAYAEHKNDHEMLLDEIMEIIDEYEGDPESASRHLSASLHSWFTVHFSTHDAMLHRAMSSS